MLFPNQFLFSNELRQGYFLFCSCANLLFRFSKRRFDSDVDGFLSLDDMKRMMENLGAPQTHLSLKKMIQEVDTDGDSKISFNEVSVNPYPHPPFHDHLLHIINSLSISLLFPVPLDIS